MIFYGKEVVHAEGGGEGVIKGHICDFELWEVAVFVDLDVKDHVGGCVFDDFQEDIEPSAGDEVAEVGYTEGWHFEGSVDHGGGVGDGGVLVGRGGGRVWECESAWVGRELPALK